MSKPRHHQLDIYGAWLHAAAVRRRVGGDLPAPESLGFTTRHVHSDGAVHLSLFIDMALLVDNPLGLVEIVTHESTHAAAMLLDHIGQEYDGESEALAYLVGFIAAWLWEACTAV